MGLKHVAGPFADVPFDFFIQSPVGLVAKDGRTDTCLIFHLSYLKNSKDSVNVNVPREECQVFYTEFDEVIHLCLQQVDGNHPVFTAKSDVLSALRNLGLEKTSWKWTVFKAKTPFDGKIYYFVDKSLPFVSPISCALFQKVSDAVAFLVKFQTNKLLVNYLDDYLFISAMRVLCNQQVEIFIQVCDQIGLPVSEKKTFWADKKPHFLRIPFGW